MGKAAEEVRDLVTIGPAARSVGLSPARLRQLEARGVTPTPPRLTDGRRVYTPGDVTALRHALEQRRTRGNKSDAEGAA